MKPDNRTFKTAGELRKAALPAPKRLWSDAGAVLRVAGRPLAGSSSKQFAVNANVTLI